MAMHETRKASKDTLTPRVEKRRAAERMEADQDARREAVERNERSAPNDQVHPLFHLYPEAQAAWEPTENPQAGFRRKITLWGPKGERAARFPWIRVGLHRPLDEVDSYRDDLEGLYERVVRERDIEIFRQSVIVLRNPKQTPLKPTWVLRGGDGHTYVGLALAWPVRVRNFDRNRQGGLLALAEHMLGVWFQADTVAEGAGIWMPNPWCLELFVEGKVHDGELQENVHELNPHVEYTLTELIDLARAAGIPVDTNRIGISKGSFGPASFMFAVRYAGHRWVQRAFREVFEFIPPACIGAHVDIILRWYRKHHGNHDLIPKNLLPIFACMAAYRILGPKGLNPIPDHSQDEKSSQTAREEATEASQTQTSDPRIQARMNHPHNRRLVLRLSEHLPDAVAEHLGRHYDAPDLDRALQEIELAVELMEGFSLPNLATLDPEDCQLVHDALSGASDDHLTRRIETIEQRYAQAAEREEVERVRWSLLEKGVDLDRVREVVEEFRNDPDALNVWLHIVTEDDEETKIEIAEYIRKVLDVDLGGEGKEVDNETPVVHTWDMDSLRSYDALRLFIRAEPMWLYRQVAARRGTLRERMSVWRGAWKKGRERARRFFVLRGFLPGEHSRVTATPHQDLFLGVRRTMRSGPDPYHLPTFLSTWWGKVALRWTRKLAGKVRREQGHLFYNSHSAPGCRRALGGLYQNLLV